MKFQIYLVLNAIVTVVLISIFVSKALSGFDLVDTFVENAEGTTVNVGALISVLLLTWVKRLYLLLPVVVLSIISPIIFFFGRYKLVNRKS